MQLLLLRRPEIRSRAAFLFILSVSQSSNLHSIFDNRSTLSAIFDNQR
jgi:hypothetical protein